jgi:putative SOS response-associated peptidase YedK
MCGRYSLHTPASQLQEHFGTANPFDLLPRYNIAPSQVAPVIQGSDGKHVMILAQWGLIPSWVKDPGHVSHPINARSETAADKPMFRHALRKGRVLVPADCFYEWKKTPQGKQPYLIRPDHGRLFAMGVIGHPIMDRNGH